MKKLFKKVFVYISVVAIIVQSLSPLAYLQLNSKAYAQEVIPTETVTPAPDQTTPTDTLTPTQDQTTVTPTPTDVPTETVVPIPTDVPTDTVTPTPTETVTPTPAPVDNNSPPSSDNSSSNASIPQVQGDSTSVTPTATLTSPTTSEGQAPVPATGNEQLNLIVLDNVSAPSIDLQAVEESGSAILTTDKPDYAPTDTALITGSNLIPNTTYTLKVWSDDQPPTGVSVQVTSDENGVFAYAYQLDGTYRPNYSAELRDLAGIVVATVTFTDSDPENVSTLAQLNIALADTSITTINITANITGITSSVVVGRTVTIDGGGFTLGFTGLEAASGGVDDGLLIQAPATINNLVVNAGLAVPTTWTGTYAIHVYNTSATLNDVTATNGNGGILVNGSAVTLTGITTVSGNGFGGIEVSASIPNGLPDSILTVTGTLVNSTEAYGKPTIWLIDEQGTVTGANVPTTTSTTIVAGQTQYYLTAGNAVNPIVCTNDAQGANDEPGQKDLTKMCADYSGLPTALSISWNWDDVSWGGSNTGDACSLYDTDGDGKANYALCVGVNDNPAVKAYTRLYSCTDTNATKCTGDTLISASSGTSCSTSLQNTDPFVGGSGYPSDTVASCTVTMADVGGPSSTLLDVCSYPSDVPHSDSSDCIIASTASQTGTVELKKVWSGTGGQTTLQIGTSAGGVDIASQQTGVNGAGPLTTGIKTVNLGTYYVSELGGLTDYTPSLACTKNGNSYTPGANNSLTVGNNDVFICTFTNTRINNGSITIEKDAQPNDAQDFAFTTTGSGLSSFSLDDDGETVILSNTKVFSNLGSGTYSVSESGVTGWSQTSATCTDGSPVSAISLQAGENVTCTFTNTAIPPKLTVTKVVTNNNGGTKVVADFPLFIDATLVTSGVQNTVSTGSHTVSETADNGYTSTITGDCASDGTITLALGDVKSCTITNNDNAPQLHLRKTVTNDNGGNALDTAWTLTATGTVQNPTNLSGTTPVDSNSSFKADTYALGESGPSGYTAGAWDCGAATMTDATHVTVPLGGDVTCTINNNDNAPSLTLEKVVTNDNGGTATPANFILTATGPTGFSGVGPSVSNGASFDAGTYTLSESSVTGYSASSWLCVGGTQDGSDITVGLGQSATCTITNTDNAPKLTLNKILVKDNGGTAIESNWTITATGPTTISGPGSAGSTDVVSGASFSAGTYTLSESGPDGYTPSSWSCTGGTQNGNQITVALDESATCTITNDDQQGTLIVKKIVVNDNGGTLNENDFSFQVNGGSTQSFEADGQNDLTVDAGEYSVTEPGVTGYTTSYDNCTDVEVSNGGNATCTITNDDIAPTLNLVKDVTNDNGGNAVAGNWDLTARRLCIAGDTDPTCGFTDSGDSITFHTVRAGRSYVLSESGPSGYTASQYSCVKNNNSPVNGNSITLAPGDTATCTITNDDIAPTVTLIKEVSGGNAGENDFGLTIGEQGIDSGQTVDVNANTPIALDEAGLEGYSFDSITGEGCPSELGGTVTLDEGGSITCTIINTRDTGDISGSKFEDLNGDGAWDEGEPGLDGWTIELYTDDDGEPGDSVDSTETSGDPLGEYRFENIPTGSYFVCEEGQDGWYQSSPNTNDGCYPVTLSENGEEITDKNFGNFRRIDVTVIKNVVDPSGNPVVDTSTQFDFVLGDHGFSLTDGGQTTYGLNPGEYDVTETLNSNYNFQECTVSGGTLNNPVYDEEDNLIGINVNVNSGDDEVTVTCVNKQKTGTITGTKWNDIDEDGIRDCELFDLGESERQFCETYTDPGLQNWHIQLFMNDDGDLGDQVGEDQITGSDGSYTFPDVAPGDYFVCEVEQSPSWNQTYPDLDQNISNCWEITVDSNGNYSDKDFGNHSTTPILTISKSNNASGNKAPGDSVGFTITISADSEGGPVDNVKVVDLLPKGFVFNSSSWKVVSSDTSRGINGDITTELTAPTYASPGTWNLEHMNSDETLTLTYTAKIDDGQASGTYYDNAWAQANPVDSTNIIFARAINPGDLDAADPSEFVGTEVAVVNGSESGPTFNTTTTQEVLGASTYLPATGENTLWVIIASLLMSLGLGSLVFGIKLRRKYVK